MPPKLKRPKAKPAVGEREPTIDTLALAERLAGELSPLLVVRTLGFLARQHGVSMPAPFDARYVPNFLTSCDRLSVECYADIVSLRAGWGSKSADANTLALVFVVTHVSYTYVERLFTAHRPALEAFDAARLEALLREWYASTHTLTASHKRKRTKAPALFRSRFTNCKSIDAFCGLFHAFHGASLPQGGPRELHEWLSANFKGVSEFTATVLLRELVLYVDRLRAHEAVALGGNQGSTKFLQARGVPPTAMEGVLDALRVHIFSMAPATLQGLSPRLRAALAPLIDRLPSFCDIENFCCEGSKMRKMIQKTYKKKRIFRIDEHPAPRMDAVPLCGEGGVELLDLRIGSEEAEEARRVMARLLQARSAC